ncbi:hypothetical protein [Kitasatospora mediocidica]|uniref:hypothetical protein n=1 Tax=Kitasatospora mediocidica TaxID=58352 RepID=UPI00055B47C5|nr:hypothetical protein [Kitasatospora mediocidica]
MPDQTPAEQLTAAAARVREFAAIATPGPWRPHDTHLGEYGHTATVLTDREELNATELVAWLPTMGHKPWNEDRNVWANSAWMALMHPAVGAALADWLDDEARAHEAAEQAAANVFHDDPGNRAAWIAAQTNESALAVARQLLGGAS